MPLKLIFSSSPEYKLNVNDKGSRLKDKAWQGWNKENVLWILCTFKYVLWFALCWLITTVIYGCWAWHMQWWCLQKQARVCEQGGAHSSVAPCAVITQILLTNANRVKGALWDLGKSNFYQLKSQIFIDSFTEMHRDEVTIDNTIYSVPSYINCLQDYIFISQCSASVSVSNRDAK